MPNQTVPWAYRTDKKVNQETEKANRKYLLGAKGGCYYLNSAGNKAYVDKEFCNALAINTKVKTKEKTSKQISEPVTVKSTTPKEPTKKTDSNDKTYQKGSHGGCYYLNGNGRKVYVDKELCS
jgi:hypothetical protein